LEVVNRDFEYAMATSVLCLIDHEDHAERIVDRLRSG
jgi:hypothetical protein